MKGFVYVISSGEGRFKIGRARDPMERMRGLQVASPVSLEMVYSVEVSQSTQAEGHAHKLLTEHRLRGEWFSVTREQAIAAVDSAAKAFPPNAELDLVPPVDDEPPWIETSTNVSLSLCMALVIGHLDAMNLQVRGIPASAVLMEAVRRLAWIEEDS